jgi:eukaryotic-like serine/threonine-protein kinase
VSDQERLEIGQTFGRYQIVRVLGEGGMGVVYEALHLGLKKRFAIKTLRPSVALIPEAQTRFLREGEAASRIHHPHVVNVVDVGTEGSIPFLVMEFLEGLSLADLLEASGRMDIERSVSLLLPAISAVAAGHAQGVVHRDLKPANVFIARGAFGESITKVLDFGVSKLMAPGDGTGLTATASVLGTAAYMSPEQAMGLKDVDGRSDQFALGQILYEMLTGARAHPGENQFEVLHNIATGKLHPPRQRRPDLPPELEKILLRMLAFSPSDRYPSLLAAGRALLPYATEKVRATLATAFEGPAADSGKETAGEPPRASTAKELSTTFRQTAAEVTANPSPTGRANRRAKIAFALIAGIGIAGSVGLALRHRPPSSTHAAIPAQAAPPAPAPEPRIIDIRVDPPQASIVLDDRPAVSGRLQATLPAGDHAAHVLRISAAGYRPKEVPFGPGTAPPPQVALEVLAKPVAAKPASRRGTSHPTSPRSGSGSAPKRGSNDAMIIH